MNEEGRIKNEPAARHAGMFEPHRRALQGCLCTAHPGACGQPDKANVEEEDEEEDDDFWGNDQFIRLNPTESDRSIFSNPMAGGNKRAGGDIWKQARSGCMRKRCRLPRWRDLPPQSKIATGTRRSN